MHYPKISIITPSYNQVSFLEETILSILNQNYPNLEYIIIDGGSTDGSVEIIKKYAHKLSYWVSETDNGQSDAINKGIEKCSGDIFNWINSDDLLAPNSLNIIASLYSDNLTIAGKVFNFYEKTPELNDYTQNKNLEYYHFLQFKSIYHQPGIWCDLKNVKETGKLNTKMHYYFDSIFYLNYFKKNKQIIYTSEVLANFRVHHQSKTSILQEKSRFEVIDYYQQLIDNKDFLADRAIIKKQFRQMKAYSKMRYWEINYEPNIHNKFLFLKFVLENSYLLKTTLFQKFTIKYLLKKIRNNEFK